MLGINLAIQYEIIIIKRTNILFQNLPFYLVSYFINSNLFDRANILNVILITSSLINSEAFISKNDLINISDQI